MVKKIITVDAGANLLTVFREHQIPSGAACSGKGICGKCKVQVIQGNAPMAEEDRRLLTAQELSLGFRLACKIRIMDHLTIRMQDSYGEVLALGLVQENRTQRPGQESRIQRPGQGNRTLELGQENAKMVQEGMQHYIAVDLGSTTLAAVLTDAQGNALAQASAANSQRAYGADILSRIQASNEGKRKQLQACICRDLERLFYGLARQQGRMPHISKIAIAGNTAMLHLLRGYSCETLGQAPFAPVNLELECLEYRELFAPVDGCNGSVVYLLPGISAFVGADIAAGFYSSGFWQAPKDKPAFFIDLGTNGELACGSREGYVTASTAAGPAFEGGRLSCGMPGIPGAISKVSYLYHRVRVQTIGQKKPCGICGTGAMEAVAALLQEGLMDTEGLLAPELFETGMVLATQEDGSKLCLTQADIREIQMAKAAIRAGIETLQKKYQETYPYAIQTPVSRIYLAGGFGYYLSADTGVSIGLFPPQWKGKIIQSGNTSLQGAMAFLTDPSCAGELEGIRRKNQSIRLESDPNFQKLYIQEMRFP